MLNGFAQLILNCLTRQLQLFGNFRCAKVLFKTHSENLLLGPGKTRYNSLV